MVHSVRFPVVGQSFQSQMMDSKVTVFLIVVLLAALRGLMQRSKVRREIEARNLTQFGARRLKSRKGPVVEPTADAHASDDDIQSTETDRK